MSFQQFMATILVVAGTALYTASAQAAFTLEFFVDGMKQGVTVTDGDANDRAPSTAGQILFDEAEASFDIAGFHVAVTSTLTNVNSPGGLVANLITNIQVKREHDGSGIGSKTLEVIATVTDFNFPVASAYLLSSKFSGTAVVSTIGPNASATFQSFFDDDNNPGNGFGTPTPLMTADSSSATNGTWGGPPNFSNSVALNGGVPFALINRTTFTLTNDGADIQSTGVTEASVVPEPGTMALLALGGLGLAGARVRGRRKASV